MKLLKDILKIAIPFHLNEKYTKKATKEFLLKAKTHKAFSNRHEVVNVFKPDEDPTGLALKRILTKEEMKFLDKICKTAQRLDVLDKVRDVRIRCFRTTKLIEMYV